MPIKHNRTRSPELLLERPIGNCTSQRVHSSLETVKGLIPFANNLPTITWTMVIISQRTLRYIKRSFTEGTYFCWHPYEWSTEKNGPKSTRSKRRLLIWYLNIAIAVGYFSFLCFQNLRATTSDATGVGQKIYMQFAMVVFSFPVFFQLNVIWSLALLPNFVRDFLRYSKEFEGKETFAEKLSNISYD